MFICSSAIPISMVTRSGADRWTRKKILKNRFPDPFLSNSISNRFLVPFRVIKRYFPLVSIEQISPIFPQCIQQNKCSVEYISRSVPCKKEASTHNISAEEIFRSVPFCFEHKEPLTNSKCIQQNIFHVPFRVRKRPQLITYLLKRFPDPFLSV